MLEWPRQLAPRLLIVRFSSLCFRGLMACDKSQCRVPCWWPRPDSGCCNRRLWETAASANGLPIVGVVGAGHVAGIRQIWRDADSPQVQRLVQEYMSVPVASRASLQATLPTIATGLCSIWSGHTAPSGPCVTTTRLTAYALTWDLMPCAVSLLHYFGCSAPLTPHQSRSL
jgi:hypothetical protein